MISRDIVTEQSRDQRIAALKQSFDDIDSLMLAVSKERVSSPSSVLILCCAHS